MVTVAAAAPTHNNEKFVFRTWMNNTGWDNNVICFITGLVNPLYALGGLDGTTVRSVFQRSPVYFADRDCSISLRRCQM